MRHLPERVRDKAIEIANALLTEGMDEGKAIRIVIAKAKNWARHRAGLFLLEEARKLIRRHRAGAISATIEPPPVQ